MIKEVKIKVGNEEFYGAKKPVRINSSSKGILMFDFVFR